MSAKHMRVRVKNILDQLKIESAPIDPEFIAQHFGLKIFYEPFSKTKGDISGCLLRDNEGKAIIGVNSTHHENRQRFTIAHEIGHYLLHKGKPTIIDRNFIDKRFEKINFRVGSSVDNDDIEELEANTFAAELLMPYDLLMDDIRNIKDIENGNIIDVLAKKYRVSRQALTIRLASLSFS